MGKGKSPWQDGRRAWERLREWHHDKAVPAQADDGDDALDALADVGAVRRLLDQAELVAVRTARNHGKSWAEIATRLGVTRQSAWERWRDLDGSTTPEPTDTSWRRGVVLDVAAGAMAKQADAERIAAFGDARGREEQARRRLPSVRVPNVVGMSWADAQTVLRKVRLVSLSPDPDGRPFGAWGWPDGIISDQSPESGAKVPSGSPVKVWFERGGGSGGPNPNLENGYALYDEPNDEATN